MAAPLILALNAERWGGVPALGWGISSEPFHRVSPVPGLTAWFRWSVVAHNGLHG
jgi:hypothetical protein